MGRHHILEAWVPMFIGTEVEEGPELEMRGTAAVGMGVFGESCKRPQEGGVSRRRFVNKA